ncbi:ABC transporter ATP-binding protein [Heyndrickxia oleronia]|jgi:peptide/nickel transport system ATP-binding protein|uniref:ABC transporter ATP-binding protein n=1 Tax=Heyndrickxia oleronia TaxID=38875 RepID=A0AAW6SZB0_9BACI|nr:ABC transporter ATP-binding protein [Heyndrickxia oleronia]MBU5211777.1 ABC transporter ATP-binding protein [Heyndrickxia oleronia]MCI1590468.1 ABC transporter ATP-binding protein [Heyndrickxia oleronia]MCI1611271.1 ABC transporter ATP-binding protein [Heyndrickxia oleronia]MCI1742713.1 ABC transporter ATP-binding protein [Heyndrickxia oleronia]MCI1762553.1 ABC transporter ATP-binding protein [Heyndrickxia oleronia]
MSTEANLKNQSPLLEVKNLETAFSIEGKLYNAVDNVSFNVKPKQIVGVVGESGCGKSVMSLSVMKLLPKGIGSIRNGEVVFEGKNIAQMSDKEMNKIRGKDISMIFQEPMTSLNPVFTIGYQLQETLFNHMSISKKEARDKSIALLKSVGISRPEKIVDEYPHQLSGGMRQRVMIAIAIACQPKLLIADEPTTALDVTVQAQILDLLKEIQEVNNMAIIMITHDLGVVAEMCDEVIVMYAGKIVEKTDVDTLFHNPKHPYTELLMNAIPKMDEEVETLSTIEGIVPSLQKMPQVGCRFANRCPKAMPECKTITPQLAETEAGHEVSCLLYETSKPKEGAMV